MGIGEQWLKLKAFLAEEMIECGENEENDRWEALETVYDKMVQLEQEQSQPDPCNLETQGDSQ